MLNTAFSFGSPFARRVMRATLRIGANAAGEVGDVMAFDWTASDAATTANTLSNGTTGSREDAIFSNLVLPSVGSGSGAVSGNAHFLGVITDLLGGAGANGTVVEVCVQGWVQVMATGTDWSTNVGRLMLNTTLNDTSKNSRTLIAWGVNGTTFDRRACAVIRAGGGSDRSGGRGLVTALFDGLHGWNQCNFAS